MDFCGISIPKSSVRFDNLANVLQYYLPYDFAEWEVKPSSSSNEFYFVAPRRAKSVCGASMGVVHSICKYLGVLFMVGIEDGVLYIWFIK